MLHRMLFESLPCEFEFKIPRQDNGSEYHWVDLHQVEGRFPVEEKAESKPGHFAMEKKPWCPHQMRREPTGQRRGTSVNRKEQFLNKTSRRCSFRYGNFNRFHIQNFTVPLLPEFSTNAPSNALWRGRRRSQDHPAVLMSS